MLVRNKREEQVLLKHHLTLAAFQSTLARLTFSPPPLHSFLDFLFSSPLCPRVISLMMRNALKVLRQPDLLKWSVGKCPWGHFSSHPSSPSSLCLLSLSCHHICCPSIVPGLVLSHLPS